MSAAEDRRGVNYQDLLPVPGETAPDQPTTEQHTSLADQPTESHALAVRAAQAPDAEHPVGAAQVDHDKEVVDLGWNEPDTLRPKPLVGGLPNEELWVLVRRFNKQMYHVKRTAFPPPGGLDLNIADEEEFSPDKLRSNVERMYMTIGIGMMAFGKHIVRLRSWRETKRTAWFCTAYFAAWMFDLIVPLFTAMVLVLIAYPPSREFLFPPVPIALVDGKSGGVQKPKAGVLGSHDSATGAPENHKGEAVEAEASNFVNGIASVALSSATGKHPQGEPEDSDTDAPVHEKAVPDPTTIATVAADSQSKAAGGKPHAAHDKTKVPMETAMWTKMRPVMHGLAELTDTWERFANALSPTPPFPKNAHRLRLAALVAPLFFVSLLTTSYMFMKGVTFGVGFGFFGQPVLDRGLAWLNRNYPNWQKLLEIRNTLLKGVPTNAQLTITLLRIGEANKAPLPPPPRSNLPPPERPAQLTDKELRATGAEPPLNASPEELDAAISHDGGATAHATGGADIDAAKNSKDTTPHKKGSKILSFFKGTTKASVTTALGADKLKAKAGSGPAKDRLGVVPPKDASVVSGPTEFPARWKGHRGHVYLTTTATIPCVAFSPASSIATKGTVGREDEIHPVWSVPIAEIRELKKIGGFGWKAKLVVGWALDREVADGLEIVAGEGEKMSTYRVTACPTRDELFNRLVAMGPQRWESW